MHILIRIHIHIHIQYYVLNYQYYRSLTFQRSTVGRIPSSPHTLPTRTWCIIRSRTHGILRSARAGAGAWDLISETFVSRTTRLASPCSYSPTVAESTRTGPALTATYREISSQETRLCMDACTMTAVRVCGTTSTMSSITSHHIVCSRTAAPATRLSTTSGTMTAKRRIFRGM